MGVVTMPDLLLRDVHPEDFRTEITKDVVDAIKPLIAEATKPPKTTASRAEMAELLGWSMPKLDRRTKDGAIPSLMDVDRRIYVIADVLDALRAGTPAAEAAAAKRQAAKQASRRQRER